MILFAGTGMNVVKVSVGALSARRPPDCMGKELGELER